MQLDALCFVRFKKQTGATVDQSVYQIARSCKHEVKGKIRERRRVQVTVLSHNQNSVHFRLEGEVQYRCSSAGECIVRTVRIVRPRCNA